MYNLRAEVVSVETSTVPNVAAMLSSDFRMVTFAVPVGEPVFFSTNPTYVKFCPIISVPASNSSPALYFL
jgi:hypothetical protein